ncbi:MAG TPA: Holliday junction resolvase RuvX [Nitrolancea sp.]|nr:Holliday junction resolvase RuvX [Nitrolancea sp.]
MALDVGARRVGVAVSDELGLIASPVGAVDLKRRGFERLQELIAHYRPARLIVGLPKNMRGGEGQQAAETRVFADNLEAATGVPVTYWDERLTTFMAEQALIESGRKRKERKERVDAVAAALILQNYLDAQAR